MKAKVWTRDRMAVKRPPLRPVELSQEETQRLLQVFIEGKQSVLEEDCMTLIKWATASRLQAALVDWMIEGSVRPVVRGQDVLVEAMP